MTIDRDTTLSGLPCRDSQIGRIYSLADFDQSAAAFLAERLTWLLRGADYPPMIGLSGGTTPGPIYSLLAAAVPLHSCLWWQVDERNVLPADARSNQNMIRQTLFHTQATPAPDAHSADDRKPRAATTATAAATAFDGSAQTLAGLIRSKNRGTMAQTGNNHGNHNNRDNHDRAHLFVAVPVEIDSPEKAAQRYDEYLRTALHASGNKTGLDMAILGMGADGHFASLFPETDWLSTTNDDAGLFRSLYVPSQKAKRYTMTMNFLRRSKSNVFLITGAAKGLLLRRVLDGQQPIQALPAAFFGHNNAAATTWLLDTAASEHLSTFT